MKKKLFIGLATGLFLYGMTNTAMALNFTGSTFGTFENPIGAEYMDVSGVSSQNPFTWGYGVPWDSLPSSLLFKGTDFSVVDEGEQFVLGELEFFNGTISPVTQVYSVDLNIGLMFSEPSGPTEQHFSFTLDLLNTLNNGTPEVNADYVSLPSSFSGTIFREGRTEYNLTLEFGDIVGGLGSSDQFHVYEQGTAYAQLMGTITSEVAPVPEPATMLLFGTGMAGLAGYRRRQQAKKE